MADSLNTIGSIANHIQNSFNNIPVGLSGTHLIEIVDMARQHVENYTGNAIGSNSISEKYQPAILDFAKADVIDMIVAQAGGEEVRLADLTIKETGEVLSADAYRKLGEMKLRSIGRKIQVARSIS